MADKQIASNAINKNEDLSWVLQSPRLTEKAAVQSGDGVYTFNVRKDANKIQVKKAIQQHYNITPIKVNVAINKPEKILGRRRQGGTKKGFKKAMVFLKKGESINFA
jgi:large subunit ribosomal protein L23